MKLFTTLLVSLTTYHLTHGWTIRSSGPETPAASLGDHQELTKTWTITPETSTGAASRLSHLELHTLGRVFVDYDASLAASGAVATIVVSGNSSELLDAIDVVNVDTNAAALRVRWKNQELHARGYLFTHVVVAAKHALSDLSSSWSGDLVVGDDVLVQQNSSDSLNLALAGSGDLYAGSESTAFTLDALNLAMAGSGDIQVLTKSLTLESAMTLSLAGSGDVAVVTQDSVTVKDALVANVAGSGSVFVQSEQLQVANLTTSIAGSGDVSYSRNGSCQHQHVAVAGSGNVAAGSILCTDSNVDIVGSGDVVVQTSGNLTAHTLFSGTVRYYGATPANIVVKSLFNYGHGKSQHKHKTIQQATKNYYPQYETKPLPPRKPVFIVIDTSASFFGTEPNVHFVLEADGDEETINTSLVGTNTQSLAMRTVHHAPDIALFAFVGAVFVTVGVVATKYTHRRERKAYQPLV